MIQRLPFRVPATLALSALAVPALADEGMWTFDAFPTATMTAAYGFAPDAAWLDRVRTATARLTGGCSSSIVSGEGLVLTNHHCVLACEQDLSTPADDLVGTGFLADDRAHERKCAGQQAEILATITDVTPKVRAAIGGATGPALVKARDAALAGIEDAGCPDRATTRCQVVTLYGGGRYALYAFRKYSDVRLVFAPEYAVGQFGGDPDNFNFPRYGLDASFLRLYEGGRPVATPQHLAWNPRAPVAGEPVFGVGNPGTTQRLFTQAQIAVQRDLALPMRLILASELRGRLVTAMAADPQRARDAVDALEGVENGFKANYGQYRSLTDPAFAQKLADAERDLRAKVAADPAVAATIGDPWRDVAGAMTAYRDLYIPYALLEGRPGWGSGLYLDAVRIVRAAAERAKPNGDRLPAFTDGALPLLGKQLLDDAPVHPWLEQIELEFWFTKVREYLGADDPRVIALLGKESPQQLAARLVARTRLGDPAERRRLFEGGAGAVAASDDPLIRLVLATDPQARALLATYRAQVEGPVTAAQAKLARARFVLYAAAVYPDATFTPRITYGIVRGWSEAGRAVPATTDFAGLYARATGADPFALPPRWIAARGRLDPHAVLDVSTTLDVVGGNSGSPAIARDGSVIGAIFDGNIHSLGGTFGYDPALNRTVVVSAQAVDAALATVYRADTLLAELHAR